MAECVEIEDVMVEMNKDINLQPWVSMFDGSKTREFVGVGIKVADLEGKVYRFVNQLAPNSTNNQPEYEVLVIELRVMITMGAQCVYILGDSQLVIRKLKRVYKCEHEELVKRF